jgi:UDP-N-acetylmuramoylalanine--D-glutamate ligase
MKIALLGFDIEGRSSLEFFKARGHQVEIRDQNPDTQVPEDVPAVLGDKYLDDLDGFDLVVRTAGLPPRKILEKNPGLEPKITSHINEFFKASPTKNIIGVTGSKGKGTTSTLIYKMLQAAGKTAYLGGNIGVPPLDFIDKLTADDWVVLELSSFQLIDVRYSPPIAVCVAMFPEHLDWHADLNEYFNAKSQLFARQTTEDTAIYFADNETSKQIASAGPGRKIPYFAPPGAFVKDGVIIIDDQTVYQTGELKLPGAHNWQNVCAAVTAVWQVEKNIDALRSVLVDFSGLEHRLEPVAEVAGVRYYNDSFGTTPETAIVAIAAFKEPKVLILGGSDKGANYDELAKVVGANDIRKVILIGNTTHPVYKATAPAIELALRAQGIDNFVSLVGPEGPSMQQIVQAAHGEAKPGDVVILSAASASFDMFKNYKERGEQFKAAVRSLV